MKSRKKLTIKQLSVFEVLAFAFFTLWARARLETLLAELQLAPLWAVALRVLLFAAIVGLAVLVHTFLLRFLISRGLVE